MQQFHDLAHRFEQKASAHLRQEYAERYRRVIGVHPAAREEFRQALERICAGGRMPVQDVIAVLERDYSPNGVLGAGRSG